MKSTAAGEVANVAHRSVDDPRRGEAGVRVERDGSAAILTNPRRLPPAGIGVEPESNAGFRDRE